MVERQFLHNTKIVTSKIYEDKAFKKSRKSKHPTGRAIAFVECMQHLLVIPEVMTMLKLEQICTKAFELRNTTKVKLSMKGHIIRSDRNDSDPNDVHSTTPPTQFVKRQMGLPSHRHFTYNQQMSYRNTKVAPSSYDKITQFGLRPTELMELFSSVGCYYRWFKIQKSPLYERDSRGPP